MAVRHLVIVFVGACATCSADLSSTLLTEWPMLHAHDAASGYLLSTSNPVYAWTRTQPASKTAFTDQLNCGARAIDFRYTLDKKSKISFHHGEVHIDHDVGAAVREIATWANQHPNVEDLVVVYASHCTGAQCDSELDEAFQKEGMTPISDCDRVAKLTVSSAAELGKLAGGGHVLVLRGCVDENYDPSLTCSGFGNKDLAASPADGDKQVEELCGPSPWSLQKLTDCGQRLQNSSAGNALTYNCWQGSSTRDLPVTRLVNYLKGVSTKAPTPGRLQEMQSLWQESAASVISGVFRSSSLLKDEEKSGLNAMVKDLIDKDAFKTINLFEVNNVCDGGDQLHASLRAFAARKANEGGLRKGLLVV